jgi:S-adenosylmethionine:tRNA ribosyltransferase-isomerase
VNPRDTAPRGIARPRGTGVSGVRTTGILAVQATPLLHIDSTERPMKTDLFDYDLHKRFIAQHPAQRRDRSRLLVLHRDTGEVEHRVFADLPDYVRTGDVMVVNDTRVVRARLYGTRATGGWVEVLLVRPAREAHSADSGETPASSVWEAMLRCRGKLADGERIDVVGELTVTLLGRDADGTSHVELACDGDLATTIGRVGRMPLPPYIKRDRSADPFADEDGERYQTVYAKSPGAVAAPTAGLHFTPELLAEIEQHGCGVAPVTLHVGPGTFKPVVAEHVEDHAVDAEYYIASRETADAVNAAQRVIAVGTTTCRVLETLGATAGERQTVRAGEGWTDLFIRPPYRFGVVEALITNFHLPRSSLLMLVSAFAGRERVLAAYEEAKQRGYRFYSYGDAMLIV